jgi:tryptophan halogenase
MVKKLTVLGGGNAGLMVALYLRAAYPSMEIDIIKSTKIGTIGVGEGSTEHWIHFADAVNIPNWEIILEAGATLKTGIKFENWHGDGTSYFHSLGEYMSVMDSYTGVPYTMMNQLAKGMGPDSLTWDLAVNGLHAEPLEANFSQFHFDSIKLNNLFLRKCSERNINVIDADIVDAILDNDGFVQSLVDENNVKYSADFFIDSSGFRRVIASKLGASWVDWSAYLPMNSAIAFPSPYEETIPPHTLAKALTSGWQWRSPVQDRFGNGYVFCDAFISEDKAIEEIQKQFPDPIEIGRKVNFISGKVDKFWIKNCVSVGLSSSFVEPLEASSISTTVQQVRVLASALSTWDRNDTATIKHYNEQFDAVMLNILDFIQLHYFTQRDDTEFWRWCKTQIKMTDFNAEHLDIFKTNFINQLALSSTNYNIFDIIDWGQVMHGLRMFDQKNIKKLYDTMHTHLTNRAEYHISSLPTQDMTKFYTSREAINIVKARHTAVNYNL